MKKLSRSDLLPLEDYAEQRVAFRAKVLAHKQHRRLQLGPHLVLLFEDRLTIQYQIQEMLRIERIFERDGIQAELDAYNPLIPDGCNLKATLQIEFADVDERKRGLERLVGVEDRVWIRVGSLDKVYAIADEDLDRENETKTSAVHFLRFELMAAMVSRLREGQNLGIGCDHEAYSHSVEPVAAAVLETLLADLD